MSDILSIQTPYVDGDTVTSTNLNDLVKKATFTSAVVDGATTQLSSGAIVVRDGGITEQKLSTATQDKLLQGPEIEIAGVRGFIGGNKEGNSRGDFAIDIQTRDYDPDPTKVASGTGASAFGTGNTASGDFSNALGSRNVASSDRATAVGAFNTASGVRSTAIGSSSSATSIQGISLGHGNSVAAANNGIAIGVSNYVEGNNSTAIGTDIDVLEDNAHAFGNNIQTSSPNNFEIGLWSDASTRKTAVKATYDGGIALTCENSASAPSDQATAGAEDVAELGRDMFTIQRNGNAFTLYFNDGGTIKSLSLGSVS